MREHTKPFRFQKEVMKEVEFFGLRSLIALEPGLGKTPVALWLARKHCAGRPVVVCVPSGLKEHWQRQAMTHVNRRAQVLLSRTAGKVMKGGHVYVVSYDSLWNKDQDRSWAAALNRVRPAMVIADEVHLLKDETSKRSRAFARLCKGVPHVLGLSGTPMPNRPIELFFFLKILKPDLFPSKWSYGAEFCAGHIAFGHMDYSGASNLKRLYCVLTNEVMSRRLKSEVLKDLPPKLTTVIPVALTPRQRKEYKFAVNDFLTWLATLDTEKARRAAMHERFLKLGYLKRLVAEMKVRRVVEWAEDFLADGSLKLMLFGIHHHVLPPVAGHFGRSCVLVNGEVPPKKRQALFDRFNNDPSCRLFVGNIHAAGLGQSVHAADCVAFCELDWVPGNHGQCIDRVRGIGRGTGRPVSVYYLVAEDTVDTLLLEILDKKAGDASAAIDGRTLKAEYRTFELLEKALVKANRPAPKRKRP